VNTNQRDEDVVLSTFLPVETRLSFPLVDGRRLNFERGTIRCGVSFSRLPRDPQWEWDWVLGRVDVTDAEGHVYRLERSVNAKFLLELVRMARGHSLQEPKLVLDNIRCAHDNRVYIPTAALVDGRVQAFAYWAKGLWVSIDLLTYRLGEWDQLLIRVHEVEGGALGGERAPTITVGTDWAVKVIVWPSLLMGCYGPVGDQPVFAATGQSAKPQEIVTMSS
jgi:hypothetical protein